ncbi:hypothetical protein [Sneathia sanguinegens]|uniref:hypothetical protein n=1 Tax=Sneathia sanguinegens TaxID=40543 RepID=UPI0035C72D30
MRVEIPKPNGVVRNLGIPIIRPNHREQQAIVKLLEYFNDGKIYVVDIDLEKFFDNVPQDKLMTLVHNLINDPDTESLIRKYLKCRSNGKWEI